MILVGSAQEERPNKRKIPEEMMCHFDNRLMNSNDQTRGLYFCEYGEPSPGDRGN